MPVTSLPWMAWSDEPPYEFRLSEIFQVERLCPDDANPWNASEIRQAIAQPIGSPPIRSLALGCKNACIAVDDLARPTQAADILPEVFAELRAAAIACDRCTIVIATGTHGAPENGQIERKIGRAAMNCGASIQVHDPSRTCPTGVRYGDNELRINKAFLASDFKLAVGGVLPHAFAGYSGGAKMLLPGLADVQATARSHKFVQMGLRSGRDLEGNRFRSEIEALAIQLGFRFTICVLTNRALKTAGVYAGDVIQAHRAACAAAASHFSTPIQGRFDAMILNAFPKDVDLVQSESALIAFSKTGYDVVREMGVIVISTAAQSVGRHGLFAPGGVSYRTPGPLRAIGNRELWIFAPNLTKALVHACYWAGYPVFSDVRELDSALRQRLGSQARIGILPAAPMQQLEFPPQGTSE